MHDRAKECIIHIKKHYIKVYVLMFKNVISHYVAVYVLFLDKKMSFFNSCEAWLLCYVFTFQ